MAKVKQPARRPLSLALGGGGMFGIAYDLGVLHGLREGGVAIEGAPAIGTSAGSWAASALALDVGYDEFDAIDAPRVPNLTAGLLAGLARELFGEARSPLVKATAVSAQTGRRHILYGSSHPLADLCATSSAVPGLLPPHRVDGVVYLDGGIRSGCAADRAPRADHLIAIAPLGGPVLFPAGRASDVLLSTETRMWKRRNRGGRVTVIRPNRLLASMAGTNPMNLFDATRAKDVYAVAVEQGQRWAGRIFGERVPEPISA